MRVSWTPAIASVACLWICACHPGGKAGSAGGPRGQVVATVDGKEITLTQLNAELAGANTPTPEARKKVEQEALGMIIEREALAQAARDQGLDKTPAFTVQKQRLEDNLLAQTLASKVADSVPAPTREEVERYMADHPEFFSQRRIFAIDQIRMARPTDPKLLKELQPLHTLADIESLLQREQVKYQRGTATLDAIRANPKLVEDILRLPSNEVFVISENGLVLVNQVRQTQITPFSGDPAVQYATALLKKQHAQDAVSNEVAIVLKKARNTISYNPNYQPPKPAAKPQAGSKT